MICTAPCCHPHTACPMLHLTPALPPSRFIPHCRSGSLQLNPLKALEQQQHERNSLHTLLLPHCPSAGAAQRAEQWQDAAHAAAPPAHRVFQHVAIWRGGQGGTQKQDCFGSCWAQDEWGGREVGREGGGRPTRGLGPVIGGAPTAEVLIASQAVLRDPRRGTVAAPHFPFFPLQSPCCTALSRTQGPLAPSLGPPAHFQRSPS